MILGIGIDLVSLDRTTALLKRQGHTAIGRLMTQDEQAFYSNNLVLGFTKIWAFKEAVIKALGSLQPLSFRDILIKHKPQGTPVGEIASPDVLRQKWPSLLPQNIVIHLSLTDDLPYVSAFCVIEYRTLDAVSPWVAPSTE